MIISTVRRIVNKTKKALAERMIGRALGSLGNHPDSNTKYIIKALDHMASEKKQGKIWDTIHEWLDEGKPGREFLRKTLKNTHPNVRRRFLARLFVMTFFGNRERIELCQQRHGITPPAVMLISPSMRCNYSCQGCYAGSYQAKDDMDPAVFDRVLSEAEDLGIGFFTILGGEPFIYPELLPIIRKHNESCFQIYSNGFFIDEAMAETLVRMGNVAPQISVNGPGEYTDMSRGKGAFNTAMQAMDNLRKAGCIFGFSSLITRNNIDAICSEEWVDLLVEKGALYGWNFLYMPVGSEPEMNLMPTPEQRNRLRTVMLQYRWTKPILPVDFWNDGVLTGGCIAGKMYFHINNRGDVEPCIFTHFSTHNINKHSLSEALTSPFLSAIRENQPFSYNTLRPCPIIDHPQTMWGLIQSYGAKPTHDGADKMFTTFAHEMKEYASGVEELMDNIWDIEDYHDWAAKHISMCRVPLERIETRRQTYEQSRARRKGH